MSPYKTTKVAAVPTAGDRARRHPGGGPPTKARQVERVVLLGASNLSRTISTALATVESLWGGPLQVMTAFGHGRSYVKESTVLGRSICGIAECGLWDELASTSARPGVAVVTDVGNDLFYGENIASIAAAVERCLDQLEAAGCRTVITGLPLARLKRLQPGMYYFIRNVIFPGCKITFEEINERAHLLDAKLSALAQRRELVRIAPPVDWYGVDPIHIRRDRADQAWFAVMTGCYEGQPQQEPTMGSLRNWLYLRSLMPASYRLFSRAYRRVQPAGRLPSGTVISLF